MGAKKLLQKYGLLKSPQKDIPTKKSIRNTKRYIFDIFANEKDKESINEYGLSQREVDKLLEQMFFQHKITDGSFLYAWDKHDKEGKENGAAKYSAVAEAPLYKKQINDQEKEIFKDDTLDEMIHNISKDKKTHIELGPESGKKFIEYSDEWDPDHYNLRDKKYIGVDISGVYVDMANKNVKKIGMVGESLPGDRFEHSVFDHAKDQIYYFFGGSIGNLDVGGLPYSFHDRKDKTIINLLRRMRSHQPFSSVPVVITYFKEPEKNDPKYQDKIDMLKATYGEKNNKYYNPKTHAAISDFILSGFEALGMERSNLELAVEYIPGNIGTPATMKVGARFNKKTEIMVGGIKVIKEKGEHIRAIKSQRFSEQMFENIANDAGFSVKYQKSREGIAVAILQSKLGMHDAFKKERNIAYRSILGLALLGGGITAKHISHEKEVQQQQKRIDSDFANTQKIVFHGDIADFELITEKEKIEFINGLTDQIFENVSIRYHTQIAEEKIKKLIRGYVKDKETLGKFLNAQKYNYSIFDISDAFTKRYSDILVEESINQLPYDHLHEYEGYFKDIILDKIILNKDTMYLYTGGTGEISNNKYLLAPAEYVIYSDIQLQCVKRGKKRALVEEKLFSVKDKDDIQIKLYLGQRTDVVDHYIKDGYVYIKKWKEDSYNYVVATTKNGEKRKEIDLKIIAYDYFYQNRPIIHEIYKKFGAIYWNMSGKYDREKDQTYRWKKDSIKILITKDLLQTGMLDHFRKDDDKAMMIYLQGFIQRNALVLQKEGIPILPYTAYQNDYTEAFENTRLSQDKNIPEIITYKQREKYHFNYMGKYYSQAGKEYDIAEATIGGKKYLFARNVSENNDIRQTEEGINIEVLDYSLSYGKEVTKDYISIKKIVKTTSSALVENNTISHQKPIKKFKNTKPNPQPKGFIPGLTKR